MNLGISPENYCYIQLSFLHSSSTKDVRISKHINRLLLLTNSACKPPFICYTFKSFFVLHLNSVNKTSQSRNFKKESRISEPLVHMTISNCFAVGIRQLSENYNYLVLTIRIAVIVFQFPSLALDVCCRSQYRF